MSGCRNVVVGDDDTYTEVQMSTLTRNRMSVMFLL